MADRTPSRPYHAAGLLAVTIICALIGQPAIACLWLYGTDAQGERIVIEVGRPSDMMESLLAERETAGHWAERRQGFEQLAPEARDYMARSDYAVALLHLGDVEEAIGVLESVEADHPGEYIVASNLGTALEMAGRLEEATRWIAEGMRRNPKAHWGSEWIHLAILDAKQRSEADPGWLASHSVLGLDFGAGLAPVTPNLDPPPVPGAPAELATLAEHLEYQLAERLTLVTPPDAVVGALLMDLASVLALTRSVEFAIPVLELALEYGPPDPAFAGARLAHFQSLVAANPRSLEQTRVPVSTSQVIEVALTVVVVVVVCVVLLRHLVKRRRIARAAAPGDVP